MVAESQSWLLKSLLDAAERGRVATVRRDAGRTAVVDVERLRHFLASLVPSRAQVVSEAGGWSVFIPGVPVAADGATFEDAIAENWPESTRKDHDAFCGTEGWRLIRNARVRTGAHHITYELDLPDGRVLRTRISHPLDRSTYGPGVWQHILRDQLHVNEAEYWAYARDGIKPDRGLPEPPPAALPAEIVHLLITRVGMTEAEVAGMSKNEAVARLNQYWAGDD